MFREQRFDSDLIATFCLLFPHTSNTKSKQSNDANRRNNGCFFFFVVVVVFDINIFSFGACISVCWAQGIKK